MKGKITKKGEFKIFRHDRYKVQNCLYTEQVTGCGDWCPQFGEPKESDTESRGSGEEDWRRHTDLNICQGKTLEFNDFEDEREVGDV